MRIPVYKNKSLNNLPNEVWVDFIGYDGYYEISNYGRLKSLPRQFQTPKGVDCMTKERILSCYINKKRLWYRFSINKVHTSFLSSKMVALHFMKGYNDEPLFFKDLNEKNLHIDNLILVNEDNVLEIFDLNKNALSNDISLLIHKIGGKRCTQCKKIKPHIEFCKKESRRGVNNTCQNCVNILVNNRYHKITGSKKYNEFVRKKDKAPTTTGTKVFL